jgi:hypothetical protein
MRSSLNRGGLKGLEKASKVLQKCLSIANNLANMKLFEKCMKMFYKFKSASEMHEYCFISAREMLDNVLEKCSITTLCLRSARKPPKYSQLF